MLSGIVFLSMSDYSIFYPVLHHFFTDLASHINNSRILFIETGYRKIMKDHVVIPAGIYGRSVTVPNPGKGSAPLGIISIASLYCTPIGFSVITPTADRLR